jgi:hypothetical protein
LDRLTAEGRSTLSENKTLLVIENSKYLENIKLRGARYDIPEYLNYLSLNWEAILINSKIEI